jgi:hypothetical protein
LQLVAGQMERRKLKGKVEPGGSVNAELALYLRRIVLKFPVSGKVTAGSKTAARAIAQGIAASPESRQPECLITFAKTRNSCWQCWAFC